MSPGDGKPIYFAVTRHKQRYRRGQGAVMGAGFCSFLPSTVLTTNYKARTYRIRDCLCRQSSTTTDTRRAWWSLPGWRRRTLETRPGHWRGSGANSRPTSLRGNTLSRTQLRRSRPLINTAKAGT